MEILNAIKSQAKEWTELNPGNPETTKLNLKGRETAAEGTGETRIQRIGKYSTVETVCQNITYLKYFLVL